MTDYKVLELGSGYYSVTEGGKGCNHIKLKYYAHSGTYNVRIMGIFSDSSPEKLRVIEDKITELFDKNVVDSDGNMRLIKDIIDSAVASFEQIKDQYSLTWIQKWEKFTNQS